MRLTQKQKAILALIFVKNEDGTPVDFDQLIERLPYCPTKDSMHFSIRALVNKGLVEKGDLEFRRGRSRRLMLITPLGEHWARLMCPKPVPLRVEQVLTEDEFKSLEESVLNVDLDV